jgi:hypothetical protein
LRLEDAWSETPIHANDRGLRAIILSFGWDDVLLHCLNVNVVVEVDDILLLFGFRIDCYLDVNILNMLLILKHISILGDNIVESNLGDLTGFANTINCAHYELVKMSIGEKVRFSG